MLATHLAQVVPRQVELLQLVVHLLTDFSHYGADVPVVSEGGHLRYLKVRLTLRGGYRNFFSFFHWTCGHICIIIGGITLKRLVRT